MQCKSIHPLESKTRNLFITTPSTDWQPCTRSVKTDVLQFDVVSDSLHWPMVPAHGHVGRVDIKTLNRSIRVGCFRKMRCARLGCQALDNASSGVKSGEPLLFVVVAKGPSCSDDVLFNLYDRLQKMGFGSGAVRTDIQGDSHVCVSLTSQHLQPTPSTMGR